MTKLPTIDIKGSEYTLVKDRVLHFNKIYPNGSIQTELVSEPSANMVVIKATVTPDCAKPERKFVDYAQEMIGSTFINKASALENASTSAVGRCLSYMGIGVVDSIASVDEIDKAKNASKNPALNKPTGEQKRTVASLMSELGIHYSPDSTEEWSEYCLNAIGVPNPNNRQQADQLIEYMQEDVLNKEVERLSK